jgi:hypothetical protein
LKANRFSVALGKYLSGEQGFFGGTAVTPSFIVRASTVKNGRNKIGFGGTRYRRMARLTEGVEIPIFKDCQDLEGALARNDFYYPHRHAIGDPPLWRNSFVSRRPMIQRIGRENCKRKTAVENAG